MIWSWADSPAEIAMVLLAGIALYGLLVYGDFHGWWR